jgi:biotin carboxyl carrier protein
VSDSSNSHHLHDDHVHHPIGEWNGLAGVRMLVAPTAGRLRHLPPEYFHDGHEWVTKEQVVAVVEQGATRAEVRSPVEGRVSGFLARDGEPVAAGQPIAWLEVATAREIAERRRSAR